MTKILLLIVPILWVVTFAITLRKAYRAEDGWSRWLATTIALGLIVGIVFGKLINQY